LNDEVGFATTTVVPKMRRKPSLISEMHRNKMLR